jgi:integrase
MATFTISIQKHQKRVDGKYPVSIRLTFKRKICYLKTEFYVTEKQLDQDFKLKDKFLIKQLINKIEDYENIILRNIGNKIDSLTIRELAEYLEKHSASGGAAIDFVKFSLKHIENIKEKQASRARRLKTTLNSFIDFFGRDMISINEITSKVLKEYENYLLKPHTITRKTQFGKDLTSKRPPLSLVAIKDYMADIRTFFNAAREEFNDDEKGEILISHYPFTKYKLPKTKAPVKRSLKVEIIRSIINAPDIEINGTHGINRAILARDVFALSFYLVGMNTVDLYNIDSYKDGRLTYNRSKTKERRQDEALISLKVEPEIIPIIKKYQDKTMKRVFCFYQMYSTYQIFNSNINSGLKQIARQCEITDSLSTYYARHSWATIARNNCRISRDDVHLALNHVDGNLKITDIYIEKDWTLIDEANRKVIDFVCQTPAKTDPESVS